MGIDSDRPESNNKVKDLAITNNFKPVPKSRGAVDEPLEKQQRLIKYIREGNALKRAMKLAGYADSTIKRCAKRTLLNIGTDVLKLMLKPESLYANIQAIHVAQEMMEDENDVKTRSYGAKLAIDNAKVHLNRDYTPTPIIFNFQTNIGRVIRDRRDRNSTIDLKADNRANDG